MVRDVRDHTFSSLDCLWSIWKELILPRASGQCELMTQRNGLDTNALRAVVRARSWYFLSVSWFSSDIMNHICSKSATPWQFLQLFFVSFLPFSLDLLTGWLLIRIVFYSAKMHENAREHARAARARKLLDTQNSICKIRPRIITRLQCTMTMATARLSSLWSQMLLSVPSFVHFFGGLLRDKDV